MSAAISLYVADVMHRRYFPQTYRFDYRVFSFLVDIDRIEEATKSPVLSHNRFNLFSLYDNDHGSRSGDGWREWIDTLLDKNGLSNAKHTIKLLCFPRVLGYAFNPLSLWYCYGKEGQLYAIVCEVSNTFGEHHHYVLHNDNQPYADKVNAHKKKGFHVSPFIDMEAEYHFILSPPDESLHIVINEYQEQALMLTATQRGQRIPFNTSKLLSLFFRMPLLTLKVMTLIHWQALKIWWRGATFYKKPMYRSDE